MEQETLHTITRIQQAFGIPVGDTSTNEAFDALMRRLRDVGKSTDEVNFDAMMEILQQMEDELQLGLPRYELLAELNVELHSIMGARLRMAADDISKLGATSAFGVVAEAQTAIETDVAAIKTDVAVIKANGATKSDVAELRGLFGELKASTKGDIADAKFQIILWVVSAIVMAQLLPIIVKLIPGVASLLT